MMDCAQLYISHHPTRRDKTVASSRRVWWCEFATRSAKLAVVVWLYLCRQMCFVAGHTEDLSRDFYLVTNDVASLLRLWSSLMLEQNDLPAVYWHLPSSMRNWVYETVGCPSVCPSLCLSHLSTAAVASGRFAERPAGRRYWSTEAGAGRSAANAGSVMLTAELSRLNTDFLRNRNKIVSSFYSL